MASRRRNGAHSRDVSAAMTRGDGNVRRVRARRGQSRRGGGGCGHLTLAAPVPNPSAARQTPLGRHPCRSRSCQRPAGRAPEGRRRAVRAPSNVAAASSQAATRMERRGHCAAHTATTASRHGKKRVDEATAPAGATPLAPPWAPPPPPMLRRGRRGCQQGGPSPWPPPPSIVMGAVNKQEK